MHRIVIHQPGRNVDYRREILHRIRGQAEFGIVEVTITSNSAGVRVAPIFPPRI